MGPGPAPDTGGGGARRGDVGRHVLGLGDPYSRGDRARLQPRRLPPRHGLAARHGDDRHRPAQVRLRRGLHPHLRGPAGGRRRRRELPAARALRRLRAGRVRDARAVSGRVPAAGLGGGRHPLSRHGRARPRARRPRAAPARSPAVAPGLAQPRRGPQPAARRLAHRPAVRAGRRRRTGGADRRAHRWRRRGRARDLGLAGTVGRSRSSQRPASPSQSCSNAHRAPTVHACTRLATGTGRSVPARSTA